MARDLIAAARHPYILVQDLGGRYRPTLLQYTPDAGGRSTEPICMEGHPDDVAGGALFSTEAALRRRKKAQRLATAPAEPSDAAVAMSGRKRGANDNDESDSGPPEGSKEYRRLADAAKKRRERQRAKDGPKVWEEIMAEADKVRERTRELEAGWASGSAPFPRRVVWPPFEEEGAGELAASAEALPAPVGVEAAALVVPDEADAERSIAAQRVVELRGLRKIAELAESCSVTQLGADVIERLARARRLLVQAVELGATLVEPSQHESRVAVEAEDVPPTGNYPPAAEDVPPTGNYPPAVEWPPAVDSPPAGEPAALVVRLRLAGCSGEWAVTGPTPVAALDVETNIHESCANPPLATDIVAVAEPAVTAGALNMLANTPSDDHLEAVAAEVSQMGSLPADVVVRLRLRGCNQVPEAACEVAAGLIADRPPLGATADTELEVRVPQSQPPLEAQTKAGKRVKKAVRRRSSAREVAQSSGVSVDQPLRDQGDVPREETSLSQARVKRMQRMLGSPLNAALSTESRAPRERKAPTRYVATPAPPHLLKQWRLNALPSSAADGKGPSPRTR